MEYGEFEELMGPQLFGGGVPTHLWRVVYEKITRDVLDAGESLQLARVENETTLVVAAIASIAKESTVWIVDHAWTFRLRQARGQLVDNPALVERLAGMLDCAAPTVDAVFGKMWGRARSYLMATASQLDEESCWYVNDEVGSCLSHDPDAPSMAMAPFLYAKTGVA